MGFAHKQILLLKGKSILIGILTNLAFRHVIIDTVHRSYLRGKKNIGNLTNVFKLKEIDCLTSIFPLL